MTEQVTKQQAYANRVGNMSYAGTLRTMEMVFFGVFLAFVVNLTVKDWDRSLEKGLTHLSSPSTSEIAIVTYTHLASFEEGLQEALFRQLSTDFEHLRAGDVAVIDILLHADLDPDVKDQFWKAINRACSRDVHFVLSGGEASGPGPVSSGNGPTNDCWTYGRPVLQQLDHHTWKHSNDSLAHKAVGFLADQEPPTVGAIYYERPVAVFGLYSSVREVPDTKKVIIFSLLARTARGEINDVRRSKTGGLTLGVVAVASGIGARIGESTPPYLHLPIWGKAGIEMLATFIALFFLRQLEPHNHFRFGLAACMGLILLWLALLYLKVYVFLFGPLVSVMAHGLLHKLAHWIDSLPFPARSWVSGCIATVFVVFMMYASRAEVAWLANGSPVTTVSCACPPETWPITGATAVEYDTLWAELMRTRRTFHHQYVDQFAPEILFEEVPTSILKISNWARFNRIEPSIQLESESSTPEKLPVD